MPDNAKPSIPLSSPDSEITYTDGKFHRLIRDAEGQVTLQSIKPIALELPDLVRFAELVCWPPRIESKTEMEIHDFLLEAFGRLNLEEDTQSLLAHYVRCTWVSSPCEFIPPLILVGESIEQLHALLQTIYAVSYHGLRTGTEFLSIAASSTCPFTMIVDGTKLSEKRLKRITSLSTGGFVSLRSGSPANHPLTLIIATTESLSEPGALTLHLSTPGAPHLSPEEMRLLTETHQPALLGYRLDRKPQIRDHLFSRTGDSLDFAIDYCVKRTAEIELRREITTLIEKLREERADDRFLDPRALLAEALYAASHGGMDYASCGKLTSMVHVLAEERGADYRPTARKTGSDLRALGLRTSTIPGGRGIRFTPAVLRTIHEVGLHFCIVARTDPEDHCACCKEFTDVIPGTLT
jgi:hypothetical protein